jgi:zinc and cadmium transporter
MFIIFLSTVLIVLIALCGNLIIRKIGHSHQIIMRLVGFSSGALLGGVFFNLLPEMVREGIQPFSFGLVLFTIIAYLLIEKFLFWRHSHDDIEHIHPHAFESVRVKGKPRSIGYINLLGDTIHNFLDGIIIFGAYNVSFEFGLATTLAIALHEIPQEISDLGVLLFSGFKFKKALLYNVIAASAVVFGAAFGSLVLFKFESMLLYLLPLAVGGFLYIAVSDMLPILREEKNKKEFLLNFTFLVFGALFMLLFKD